jgi:hypothetical protein
MTLSQGWKLVSLMTMNNIFSFGKDEYFQLLEPHEAQKITRGELI